MKTSQEIGALNDVSVKDYHSKRFASRQVKLPGNNYMFNAASTAYADERGWRHQGKTQSVSYMAPGLRAGLKPQRSAQMGGRAGLPAGVGRMQPGSRSSTMGA